MMNHSEKYEFAKQAALKALMSGIKSVGLKAKDIPKNVKQWMHKLDPVQQKIVDKAPHWQRADMQKLMEQQAYHMNRKIMLWGGIPPVVATGVGVGANQMMKDDPPETSLDQISNWFSGSSDEA